jgi:hypothetical protein
MVELIERREKVQTGEESGSAAEVVGGFVLGLVVTVGPWLATGGGLLECSLPLAAVAGPFVPPDDADVRWYTSRALLVVGVVVFFVVAIADPLSGDTDFLAAVTAILVGAALSQTDDG